MSAAGLLPGLRHLGHPLLIPRGPGLHRLPHAPCGLGHHRGHPVLVLRLRAGLAPGPGGGYMAAVHPLHHVVPIGGHRGVALHLGHVGGEQEDRCILSDLAQ